MKAVVKIKTRPTILDGFDSNRAIIEHGKGLIKEKNKKKRAKKINPWIIIPTEWKTKYWFAANTLAKCLRWAAYEALGFKGLVLTYEEEARLKVGRAAHIRLEREFSPLALGKEILIFDPKYHIRGYCDLIARNSKTGELFIVDFKTRIDWTFRQIKRKGLREHLKDTTFYPPDSDDELQVMLYIHMARQCGLDIIYGVIIYENLGDPNPTQRKSALIEYDEKLVLKYLEKVREMERLVKKGKLIETNLPPEDSNVHGFCPYREICPVGQRYLMNKGPKRNYPIWVLLRMKREKKSREEMRLKVKEVQTVLELQ